MLSIATWEQVSRTLRKGHAKMTLEEFAEALKRKLKAHPSAAASEVAKEILSATDSEGKPLSSTATKQIVDLIERPPPRPVGGVLKEADDQRAFLDAVKALRAAIDAAQAQTKARK